MKNAIREAHLLKPLLLSLCTAIWVSGCGGAEPSSSTGGAQTDSASLTGSASVTIAWDSPTTTVNQNCTTDLSGYTVYAGRSMGVYALNFRVPSNAASCTATGLSNSCGQVLSCSYTISGLANGAWHFAVTAYDGGGSESAYSDDLSHTL